MLTRWLVIAVLVSTPALAEELSAEVDASHPRFFAGGYGSGAFIGPGTFSAGPLGVAFDLGLQLDRRSR